MPKKFTDCVKKGGTVRTIKPNKSSYMKVCSFGGKTAAGHVKRVKKK